MYREYTDATFGQSMPAPAQHGILGPILHARIGDTLTVFFRVSFSASTPLSPIKSAKLSRPPKGWHCEEQLGKEDHSDAGRKPHHMM